MRIQGALSEVEVLEAASNVRLNVGRHEICHAATKPSLHLQTHAAPAKVENEKLG